jgi:hypothetical protein
MRGSPLSGMKPVLDFRLPPAPKEIAKQLAEQLAEYERDADLVGATEGELADARDAIPTAQNRDLIEFSERLREDAHAQVTGEHESAARKLVAALEAKLAAAGPNADASGNTLVRAVTLVVPAWHMTASTSPKGIPGIRR